MNNTKTKLTAILAKDPTLGLRKLAKKLGVNRSTVQYHLKCMQKSALESRVVKKNEPLNVSKLAGIAHKMISSAGITPADLADALGIEVSVVPEIINELQKSYTISFSGKLISLSSPPSGRLDIEILGDHGHKFGLVSDTHLACKEERLKELHLQYDLFVKEKITKVFHAGNIVDGYAERLNGASVICSTVDGQVQYVIDNYPRRDGITTYFITGDDHESWFSRGFNFGKYLMDEAIKQGRTDLVYIGHVEADVELRTPGGSAIMKVQHPGGGSSYARSYTQQKTIESFEGGEKPAILIQGHYHVSNFMQDRNIYVVSMPGFQDQTIFARKKRLRMEVGGAIIEFWQNPHDGSVTRCKVEFNRYFDRGYYKAFIRSDASIVKGHLVIDSNDELRTKSNSRKA